MSIKELCSLAGVSRSGYYNWLASLPNKKLREDRDRAAFALILEAYNYRGYAKGARSIHMRLLHIGTNMNIKKIRRLMKKYDLFCPIRSANPYRRIQAALRTSAVADNLLNREFKEHGCRKVLLTDITYLQIDGVHYYLSVIIDAFTTEALAYKLSDSLEIDFVLETVNDLIRKHGISLDAETLIHSDQGAHYTSVKFRELIADYGLRQSMSRRGNCWDNAPQESFFGHMKDEIKSKMKHWRSMSEIQSCIDDWIDYYNNDRYKVELKMLSPKEYYEFCTTGKDPLARYR